MRFIAASLLRREAHFASPGAPLRLLSINTLTATCANIYVCLTVRVRSATRLYFALIRGLNLCSCIGNVNQTTNKIVDRMNLRETGTICDHRDNRRININ